MTDHRSRGYALSTVSVPESSFGNDASHETLATEAIGAFIEFWGFKRNSGRLWSLLYIRDEPMTAGEIQRALSLTKGAISLLVRDLEYWGVVHRTRAAGQRTYRYVAEKNLIKLVARVLREREANLILRVKTDLEAAQRAAAADPTVPSAVVKRIRRLRTLAKTAEHALALFLQSTQLSMTTLLRLMRTSL